MTEIADIEQEIEHQRRLLDAWLDEIYRDCEEKRYIGERDCNYENWHEIETLLGRIFDQRFVSQLSYPSLDHLLFFISRSDELGRIIAWLSCFTGKPLSWVGDLLYEDFLVLCHRALERNDDDCDFQLMNCFRKQESLSDSDIKLLIQFFERKTDSYTRRVILHVLSEFQRPEAVPLAKELWETDDCEFARVSCLEVLKSFPAERTLFERYLQEHQRLFPVDEADYRSAHLKRLRSNPTD